MKTLLSLIMIPFRFAVATIVYLMLLVVGFILVIVRSIIDISINPFSKYWNLVKDEFSSWLKYPFYPLKKHFRNG